MLYEFNRLDPQALRDTLVVFTSDHGDMMWETTITGEKRMRIRGVCTHSFIVRYPASWDMPRGQTVEAPVELRDIMPTMLDAAGVDIPDLVDGQSLLPLARGQRDNWRTFVQGEHTSCYTHEHGMQYVTDGKEKDIWFHHTERNSFLTCKRSG